jgi:diaminohydroxyphosphoribosylaminopyrimidine deaminase / 5-amino-6-(5-phosphoribosylamino)uracil reductase
MSTLKSDGAYMRRALMLAVRGRGRTSPNPMVGCVIVRDGTVVGEGWHRAYGQAHAEVEALRDAGDHAPGATMYVTLEPCNHHGQTPPCTNAVLTSGIARLVVAMPDPNPAVKGGGAAYLASLGITVEMGIERSAAENVNEVFLANTLYKRPFVAMKIAQSLDGMIAPERGGSRWISSETSRITAHRLRSEADAVLIGARTARMDNPSLTVRHIRGPQPWRVVLARDLGFSPRLALFTDGRQERSAVIIADGDAQSQLEAVTRLRDRGVRVLVVRSRVEGPLGPRSILGAMRRDLGVRSVLVEGGAALFTLFLEARLVDRLDVFTAPFALLQGQRAIDGRQGSTLAAAGRFVTHDTRLSGGDVHTVLRRPWRF